MGEDKQTQEKSTDTAPATTRVQTGAPETPPSPPAAEYGLKELPQDHQVQQAARAGASDDRSKYTGSPSKQHVLSSLASLRHDLKALLGTSNLRPGQGRGDQLYKDQTTFDKEMRERALDLVTAHNRSTGGNLPIDRLSSAEGRDQVTAAIQHALGQVDAAEKVL